MWLKVEVTKLLYFKPNISRETNLHLQVMIKKKKKLTQRSKHAHTGIKDKSRELLRGQFPGTAQEMKELEAAWAFYLVPFNRAA